MCLYGEVSRIRGEVMLVKTDLLLFEAHIE